MNKIKTLRISAFSFLLSAFVFAGCTTTGGPDLPRIAAVVQEAARIGTREAVRENPQWRPQFVLARDQLTALAARPSLTPNDLLEIIAALPVAELSSDTARIVMDSARLTLIFANWSTVEIVRTEQVRPIATALASGITAGLPAAVNGNEARRANRPPPPSQPGAKKHYRSK